MDASEGVRDEMQRVGNAWQHLLQLRPSRLKNWMLLKGCRMKCNVSEMHAPPIAIETVQADNLDVSEGVRGGMQHGGEMNGTIYCT
jgi:hypothetical protein